MIGKYISVGIGSSKNKDPYKAGIEAAQKALSQIDKEPTFSIVYTNAAADQNEIVKGINEKLGKNWVGASADKQFDSESAYDKDTVVSVLCIKSNYLHFGVGVAENYRKNPKEEAIKATRIAMKDVKRNPYVDAYIQFTRTKKQEYNNIVRTPPYFILTFASGAEFKNKNSLPGNEIEFLNGILEYLGPHIPVFGGSASSDFEEYLYKNKGENYQFANGKVLTNSGVVVFVVCNLFFTTKVKHSYMASDKFAAITKLDKTGYEILEINGNEPILEYCKLINCKKVDYLKDPFRYSLKNPFGIITLDGHTYVREALPNPDNKTFHSTYKLIKNYVMNILQYDKINYSKPMLEILNDSIKKDKPAVTLFCNCSTRRLLVKDGEKKIQEKIKSTYKNLNLFGFYSFGEFGSDQTSSAQLHSETVTALTIYDQLLVEGK